MKKLLCAFVICGLCTIGCQIASTTGSSKGPTPTQADDKKTDDKKTEHKIDDKKADHKKMDDKNK